MTNFYAVDAASSGGGGGGLVSSVSDTNSIDLTVTAGDLTADLKLSAAAAGAGKLKISSTIETDGLLSQVSVGALTDAGTDGITVTGGTGAVIGAGTSISQRVADAAHNGYLSSTDWSTFNAKQAALTIGNLTDVGTDGITVTGGTGAVIGSGTSIAQRVADSTHNGYLSSTDWSTFNAKQASGNYITALSGDVVATGPGAVAATIQPGVIDNGKVSASAAIAFSKLAGLTAAHILVGSAGGVATDVAVSGDISMSNAGATAYSGTVPLNKGGTGQTTKAPAFDALSPMSAAGDLILGGASGTGTRLGIGSNTFVLTSNGTTAAWAANAAAATATPTTTGLTSSYTPVIQSGVTTITSANGAQTANDGFEAYLFSTGGSNRTFTLPSASGQAGRVFYVKKIDSGTGQVSIVGTIDGVSNYTLYVQNDAITIMCDGSAYYIINKSLVVNSQVRSDTGNATSYGSTDTKIRRLTNHVTTGTGITPLSTATNGTTYTIVQPGSYSFSRTDAFNSGATYIGFSLNSANLTTNVTSLNAAERIDSTRTITSEISSLSACLVLAAGDVIRLHDNGACDNTSNQVQCVITQMSRV